MAIPSRQIGWSAKDNLLWEISKQLEALIKTWSGEITPTTTTTSTTIFGDHYLLTQVGNILTTQNVNSIEFQY